MTAVTYAAGNNGDALIVRALLEAGAGSGQLDEVCVCGGERGQRYGGVMGLVLRSVAGHEQ
jgi:hypothetical protein